MHSLKSITSLFCKPAVAVLALVAVVVGCGHNAGPSPAFSSQEANLRSDNAINLYQRGREAARMGDSIRAEQYLSMAANAGYDQRRILPLILKVCLQGSRLRSALDHAEPYLLQHPEDQALRFLVATIHLSLGHIDAAKICLEELLRANEQNPDAQYLLGILAMDSAPSEATEHLNKYLTLSPKGDRSAEAKSRLTELDVRLIRLRRAPVPIRALSTTTGQQDSIESRQFSNTGADATTTWFDDTSVRSTSAQAISHQE